MCAAHAQSEPDPITPSFSWTSERTLRIHLGDTISDAVATTVARADVALRMAAVHGVVDIIPAYTTLLVCFDPCKVDHATAELSVRAALSGSVEHGPRTPRRVKIPVCYDAECAPDLVEVAELHSLRVADVVRLHCEAAYTVHFLGFSPGFAYLGGLPERLATPRLPRPRTAVPPGSVAIGGAQTGIYPHSTPGGWRLIGRTPLVMFDPARRTPATLAIGDEVCFLPIDRSAFDRIAQERGL